MRVRNSMLFLLLSPFVLLIGAAYVQWAVAGLPELSRTAAAPSPSESPQGFPFWLRATHYVNLLFMILLIRSGLQILMDHPRLYWNAHCTPGTEWLRLTPVEVSPDQVSVSPDPVWTSSDDARHLSPWIGLPGFRHTIGMARHWHFISALFWMANGAIYVTLLFGTGQWRRLVPTSWRIVPDAWGYFVHYATFHLPPEPDAYYRYNPLQQLGYFGVVFVLAPLAMVTSPMMSPAVTARFKWSAKLPSIRQVGRSIKFLTMAAFVGFLVMHVTLVVITGLATNMNRIVLGGDAPQPTALYVGFFGIGVLVVVNVLANWAAWRMPRTVQHAARWIVNPMMWLLLARAVPRAQFRREDISPYFWLNGKMPTSPEWEALADHGFRDFRLEVSGLVENPVQLSLDDLRALGEQTQITLHHCIQGWSGIAAWGGVPVSRLIGLVRPKADVQTAVFHSFAEGPEGGPYYETILLEEARYDQTLLAYDMNFAPLTRLHGAPLRLRVETELGFKMVKWVRAIEFIASPAEVGEGEGGYHEDREYFGELAPI